MLIDCPCCGPRGVGEFAYGGDATVERPADDKAPFDTWCAYVYERSNPRGSHLEYWQHVGGCRCWLRVERNVTTHAIGRVELVGSWAAAPGLEDAAE